MIRFDKESALNRIKSELKVPKDYNARLRDQLKRYAATKTPEELKEHILSDWIEHSKLLEKFWASVESLHEDVLGDLTTHLNRLKIEIYEGEEIYDHLMKIRTDGCKALFHEQKLAALKEYISIGVNPKQAAEMVMDTDRHCNTLAIEERIKEEYKKWKKQDY